MSKFREVPVAYELQEEINRLAGAGLELLGLLGAEGAPRAVATAINDYIAAETLSAGTNAQLDDVAVTLGCLWGEQLRRGLTWEWVHLHPGAADEAGHADDNYLLGIAPDDRRFVIFPIDYIGGLLEDGRDSTALLLYNMLEAGNVPPADPGSYFELG